MASNVVPYNPVPSQAPNAAPASPYLRVPSGTEEAAGVGVAQATVGLGREVQQASDVVASHVLQLQNLDNETWAKDNDVTAMIQIGQTMSEFDQLEGKNAIDAMPQYQDRIKKIRQDLLDNAPNPMARRMLDQSISRRVGFALVDMGHKAGTQLRTANKQASVARVNTAVATADPSSANNLTLAEKTISSEIEAQGQDQGQQPDTIAENKRKALSNLWLTSIGKAGPNEPEKAKAIFELRKDQMDPNVREQAQALVNRYMASKQTRADAQAILDKIGFDPVKGPGQLVPALEEAKKMTEKKGQDNPDYGFYLEERVKSLVATGMSGYRDQQAGYKNDLGKFILGENDAKRVVSMDGIIGPQAPVEVRKAFNALDPSGQKMIMNWVHKMSTGGANQWTPEKLKREQQLRGMASDPEQADDFYQMGPDAIIKEGFPLQATRSLLNLQNTIKTRAENVQLSQAMSLAQAQLDAAGINRRDNPEAYNQFRGAMEDQIKDLQGEQKAKVTPEQVRTITARLLRESVKSSWIPWQSGSGPTYAPTNIPEDFRKTITQQLIKQRGVEPTEQDIQRWYSYVLYRQLYPNKSQPKAELPKVEVPQSR